VSPQLWAWRKGRVRAVARLAREVLCLLPFEVPFYAAHGVTARYVGHPLVDEIARVGLLGARPQRVPGRLALLPGSRAMEVRQLLPVMLRTMRSLDPCLVREAVLVEAPGVAAAIDAALATSEPDARLHRVAGRARREELARSQLAWTASGTATLECALLDVPMVVGYRLRGLSFALARLLVRVPHVALVNLIAERGLAPELLQRDFVPGRLAAATHRLFGAEGEEQRQGLARVRERLGPPGASRAAARAVAEHLRALGIG
jgi:lipid-A-disaccharide synthase